MSGSAEREDTLVRYLLGRLPEADRVRLEDRFLNEPELDDQLLQATDDLIHDYLEGDLSADDRSHFESHFLDTEGHRERLEFVQGLVTLSRRDLHVQARRFPVWLAAAAGLALALLGAWFWMQLRPEGPPQQAGLPPTVPEQTSP